MSGQDEGGCLSEPLRGKACKAGAGAIARSTFGLSDSSTAIDPHSRYAGRLPLHVAKNKASKEHANTSQICHNRVDFIFLPDFEFLPC